MKQVIRKRTFETNSSSMHSIVISKQVGEYTEEEIKESFFGYYRYSERDGESFNIQFLNDIHNEDLSFGRAPFDVLYTYCDKLRYYLASMRYTWTDDDYSEFIGKLKELHPFIGSITFSVNSMYPEYDSNKLDYGSVDHQSACILRDFLLEKSLNVEEFLKSKSYVIIIDGDEYGVTRHLIDAKIVDLKEEPYEGGEFNYVV